MKRRITLYTLATLVLAGLLGWYRYSSIGDSSPRVITVGSHLYEIKGAHARMITKDENTYARYGVISDIHGETEKARAMGKLFKKRDVDAIIVLGDTPLNEPLRYHRSDGQRDEQEIYNAFSALAETGLLLFVIPGNHELKRDYEAVLARLRHYPIIDMAAVRVFDGDDADLVSLPGYQTQATATHTFVPDGGYWADPSFIRETARLKRGLDDAVLLVTHGPPKTTTPGPGTLNGGIDAGDEETRNMMRSADISFVVSGHIHEAGGQAVTLNGTQVPEKTWSDSLILNVGSIEPSTLLDGKTHNGMGAMVTLDGAQAMYELVYLP